MHVVRKQAKNVFETRFFHAEKASNNIRTLHSQPTVAGSHYQESSSFLTFSVPTPTHSAAADRKSRNIHIHRFLRASNKHSECPCFRNRHMLIIHGEWRRGFSSLRENISLMGMLRYLHQFIKSKLESGTSLNCIYVIVPTAEERRRVYVHSCSSFGRGRRQWTRLSWCWLNMHPFAEHFADQVNGDTHACRR